MDGEIYQDLANVEKTINELKAHIISHPTLASIWIAVLENRVQRLRTDTVAADDAINAMKSLPDISIEQLHLLYNVLNPIQSQTIDNES